jgi:hypothetical protein
MSARLGTALLVRLVEQRAHLGIFAQHGLVEMRDQRLAAGFQQRHGGLDDLALTFGKHANLLVAALPAARLERINANGVPATRPLQNNGLQKYASI